MLDLDRSKRYLLACSYGPDSMALFDMLVKGDYTFEVAHVNYNLRPESKKEAIQLEAYCSSKNIPFHVHNVTENICKGNIENNCRVIRYKFFKSLFEEFNEVLVAHNQDDLIETFLMQKRRGNYVKYYGINEEIEIFGIKVRRPLLKFKKSYLKEYCDKNFVPYCVDKTNLENAYIRNQIRHSIVEKMSDMDRILIVDEINLKNRFLENTYEELELMDLYKSSNLIKLDEKHFILAINLLMERMDSSYHISKKQCGEIKKILLSDKPNVELKLNLYYKFVKSYDTVDIVTIKETKQYAFMVSKPSKIDNEYFYMDFTSGSDDRNVSEDDYPIIIRNANSNDIVTVKNYVKTVRRLFIDWKMPIELRNRWPVIINKDGKVIYIPRYKKDFTISDDLNFYVK